MQQASPQSEGIIGVFFSTLPFREEHLHHHLPCSL